MNIRERFVLVTIVLVSGLVFVLSIYSGRERYRTPDKYSNLQDSNQQTEKQGIRQEPKLNNMLLSTDNTVDQFETEGLIIEPYPSEKQQSTFSVDDKIAIVNEFLINSTSGDHPKIDNAIEMVSKCKLCWDDLKVILLDSNNENALRGYAAIALVKANTTSAEPVLAVIEALIQTEYLQQSVLKEGLVQALRHIDPYDVDVLVSVLSKGQALDIDLSEMNDEIRRILEDSINAAPDPKAIGLVLSERYLSDKKTEGATRHLENIGHPEMYSELIRQTYGKGDPVKGFTLLQQLAGLGNPQAISSVIWLAGNEAIPFEDVYAALEVSGPNKDDAAIEVLAGALIDFDLDAKQRAAAATALANTVDPRDAHSALMKASEHEQDELVRLSINSALDRIEIRLEQAPVKPGQEVKAAEYYRVPLRAQGQIQIASPVVTMGAVGENRSSRSAAEGKVASAAVTQPDAMPKQLKWGWQSTLVILVGALLGVGIFVLLFFRFRIGSKATRS